LYPFSYPTALYYLIFMQKSMLFFKDYAIFRIFVRLHKNEGCIMFNFDKFEKIRDSRGVSKAFVARAIGRTSTCVQDWKQGKSSPSAEQIAKIAEILCVNICDMCDICDGEDVEESYSTTVSKDEEHIWEYLDMLKNRPECRILLDTARNTSKEEVEANIKIIEALRGVTKHESD